MHHLKYFLSFFHLSFQIKHELFEINNFDTNHNLLCIWYENIFYCTITLWYSKILFLLIFLEFSSQNFATIDRNRHNTCVLFEFRFNQTCNFNFWRHVYFEQTHNLNFIVKTIYLSEIYVIHHMKNILLIFFIVFDKTLLILMI